MLRKPLVWYLLAVLTVPTTAAPATKPAPQPASSAGSPDSPTTKTLLKFNGKIAFGEDSYSKVSSPIQGRVVEVRAKLGQQVKKGDVLLVLDSPDLMAAYSDYLKETSEFEFATRSYNLAKDLYGAQATSHNDLKQAENTLRKEEAEYNRAKEKLLALKVPRSELEKPLGQQHVSGRFELKSAVSGTVVDRTVTPGQWVGNDPSQILLTVADLDRLQIIVDVYEHDLPLIHTGDPAMATVEAYPGEVFPAVIAKIGDVVDRDTKTVKVRAMVKDEGRKLKQGMYAQLTLTRVPGPAGR